MKTNKSRKKVQCKKKVPHQILTQLGRETSADSAERFSMERTPLFFSQSTACQGATPFPATTYRVNKHLTVGWDASCSMLIWFDMF